MAQVEHVRFEADKVWQAVCEECARYAMSPENPEALRLILGDVVRRFASGAASETTDTGTLLKELAETTAALDGTGLRGALQRALANDPQLRAAYLAGLL
jgi:hypothetical protein